MSSAQPLPSMPRAGNEFATLGGGCFWCTEAVYMEVEGVCDVESGYSGGHMRNPDYRTVCAGTTGHAEVVRLEFDPQVISYREILEIFFATHDATTLNRQGGDIGTQYRSAIYTHSDVQAVTARALIAEAQAQLPAKIVTEVLPAPEYYRAEDYHQEYFKNNPDQGYCAVIVGPKVAKFRKTFAAKQKKSTAAR